MRGLGLEAVAYDTHAADDQRHHGDTDRDPGEHAPLRLAVLAGCVDGESGQQYRQQREERQQTPAVHTDEGDQQEHRGDDDREHRQLGGLLVADIGCVGCIGSVRSAGGDGDDARRLRRHGVPRGLDRHGLSGLDGLRPRSLGWLWREIGWVRHGLLFLFNRAFMRGHW